METKPDTIKISATYQEELQASHADLFVTVRGSSVVGGDQALKKAREVSQLVEELARFGLPAERIHLEGIHIETASGALLKSSNASYRLRMRCDRLEQIPELLDIIALQRNAILERIDWKYPEEESRERGLEAALQTAKVKAEKVAGVLGVKLLGIHDFNENSFDEERPPMPFQAQAFMAKGRERADEPSLGMEIQHSKMMHVQVEVWYRVSGFSERD
jgi:uncharacterized protein YggE